MKLWVLFESTKIVTTMRPNLLTILIVFWAFTLHIAYREILGTLLIFLATLVTISDITFYSSSKL